MHTLVNLFAYGEFSSTTYWGMLGETLPFFLRWVIPPALLCVVALLISERRHCRWLGPLVFLGVFVMALPTMGVMGAWGPAHVAMGAGFPAWILFAAMTIAKALLVPRPCNAPAPGRCSRCNYDTSACRGPACPECGTSLESRRVA
ncbi:MAG: hypothetical protein JNM94_10675 [Phycisphaerae bacterium]|nr:hypothetical protein [Phycisphaerae bacterium]